MDGRWDFLRQWVTLWETGAKKGNLVILPNILQSTGTVTSQVDAQGDHSTTLWSFVMSNRLGVERLSTYRDVCQEVRRIKWWKDL